VFNCEEYIFSAMDSILKQTYCDFELIVINDASNDGTMEVVNSIVDSRIKIINLEINCGIVTALNKGLEVSRGEFIARMDADDISLPTRLATQVQYLDAHPQVGLIGCWIKGFGENIDSFIHRYPLLDEEIKCRLLFENSFAHSTILFRKSILDVNGLKYDTNFQYVEDWNLWSQLSRYTKFSNIPTPLVEYRIAEKGKKYREFQHSQKEKLISKNLFTANFPYREIDIDRPSVDRGSLKKLASYLCELREANAESHAFKPHIFERQLSWIWVRSCMGLGKIGFFYSLYDNKKYHLNISSYDILNVILCMVRFRFSDFIFLKMNNWIRR
jgi:glycosyltransferase involved in cell wall biosynthesis